MVSSGMVDGSNAPLLGCPLDTTERRAFAKLAEDEREARRFEGAGGGRTYEDA